MDTKIASASGDRTVDHPGLLGLVICAACAFTTACAKSATRGIAHPLCVDKAIPSPTAIKWHLPDFLDQLNGPLVMDVALTRADDKAVCFDVVLRHVRSRSPQAPVRWTMRLLVGDHRKITQRWKPYACTPRSRGSYAMIQSLGAPRHQGASQAYRQQPERQAFYRPAACRRLGRADQDYLPRVVVYGRTTCFTHGGALNRSSRSVGVQLSGGLVRWTFRWKFPGTCGNR